MNRALAGLPPPTAIWWRSVFREQRAVWAVSYSRAVIPMMHFQMGAVSPGLLLGPAALLTAVTGPFESSLAGFPPRGGCSGRSATLLQRLAVVGLAARLAWDRAQ
jgi:hypothetical protein